MDPNADPMTHMRAQLLMQQHMMGLNQQMQQPGMFSQMPMPQQQGQQMPGMWFALMQRMQQQQQGQHTPGIGHPQQGGMPMPMPHRGAGATPGIGHPLLGNHARPQSAIASLFAPQHARGMMPGGMGAGY